MKLLPGLQRDGRHLGVRGTIEAYLALREDRAFDRKNRTDTSGRVELNTLSISSPTKSQGSTYVPTPARALRHCLSACRFPSASVFVDLGCGKGRALLVASHFGFKRVVGVDFSRELCGIATANVRAYRERHRHLSPFDIIEADAAEHEVKPDENVFYMYNPFGSGVVNQVVRNISASMARHGRPVWIIYYDPANAGEIESSGTFMHLRTFRYGKCVFAVYASRQAPVGQMLDGNHDSCRFGRV